MEKKEEILLYWDMTQPIMMMRTLRNINWDDHTQNGMGASLIQSYADQRGMSFTEAHDKLMAEL